MHTHTYSRWVWVGANIRIRERSKRMKHTHTHIHRDSQNDRDGSDSDQTQGTRNAISLNAFTHKHTNTTHMVYLCVRMCVWANYSRGFHLKAEHSEQLQIYLSGQLKGSASCIIHRLSCLVAAVGTECETERDSWESERIAHHLISSIRKIKLYDHVLCALGDSHDARASHISINSARFIWCEQSLKWYFKYTFIYINIATARFGTVSIECRCVCASLLNAKRRQWQLSIIAYQLYHFEWYK